MPFDFIQSDQSILQRKRADRGLVNHLKGMASEEAVVCHYQINGYRLLERRWRGQAGEIDLIFAAADDIIFVEVKASRTFDTAASHLSTRQAAVIGHAIDEYLGGQPKGSLTDIRFDLAMVDGKGRVDILENALVG